MAAAADALLKVRISLAIPKGTVIYTRSAVDAIPPFIIGVLPLGEKPPPSLEWDCAHFSDEDREYVDALIATAKNQGGVR